MQLSKELMDIIDKYISNMPNHPRLDDYKAGFEDGFQAGVEAMKQREAIAIEALTWYKNGMLWDDSLGNLTQKAREALAILEAGDEG